MFGPLRPKPLWFPNNKPTFQRKSDENTPLKALFAASDKGHSALYTIFSNCNLMLSDKLYASNFALWSNFPMNKCKPIFKASDTVSIQNEMKGGNVNRGQLLCFQTYFETIIVVSTESINFAPFLHFFGAKKR